MKVDKIYSKDNMNVCIQAKVVERFHLKFYLKFTKSFEKVMQIVWK